MPVDTDVMSVQNCMPLDKKVTFRSMLVSQHANITSIVVPCQLTVVKFKCLFCIFSVFVIICDFLCICYAVYISNKVGEMEMLEKIVS